MSHSDRAAEEVRKQYERYPYPPLHFFAVPVRGQGARLRYALGLHHLRHYDPVFGAQYTARGPLRILVAGCGTVEPLVVAHEHPGAREIVAVDFSQASITRLRRRLRWADFGDRLRGGTRTLPPIRCVCADLQQWEGGQFDYVIATHVLQHSPDPAALFAKLVGMLRPGGLLRMVTYPCHSRFWVRETGRWLRSSGLSADTPQLPARARRVMRALPAGHPLRQTFFDHREHRSSAGIVDAFLHAWERPLSMLDWREIAAANRMVLIGESQHPWSRSDLLTQWFPATAALDRWQRLAVLDALLELTANPVLWLVKSPAADVPACRPAPGRHGAAFGNRGNGSSQSQRLTVAVTPCEVWQVLASGAGHRWDWPSPLFYQLGEGLRQAQVLLEMAGLLVDDVVARFGTEFGPHVSRGGRGVLNGHSLCEYDLELLRELPRPWAEPQWRDLDRLGNGQVVLQYQGRTVPGKDLVSQAAWLAGRLGAVRSSVPCELVCGG